MSNDMETTIIVRNTENGVELINNDKALTEILDVNFTLDDLAEKITKLLNSSLTNSKKSNVKIDLKAGIVTCNGVEKTLLAKEIKLLDFFSKHAGEIISRETLLNSVWNTKSYDETRTLDVHISRLRKKIGDVDDAPQIIQTVRGIGYKYIAP